MIVFSKSSAGIGDLDFTRILCVYRTNTAVEYFCNGFQIVNT
jgi:hypothetical protein